MPGRSGVTNVENRIRFNNTDTLSMTNASSYADTGEDNQASINQYRSAIGGKD